MTTDRKKPGVAFWATVVVVCLPALYVGAYCWMVEPLEIHPSKTKFYCLPSYPLVNPSGVGVWYGQWERFFSPIHSIDRHLKPTVWNGSDGTAAIPSATRQ